MKFQLFQSILNWGDFMKYCLFILLISINIFSSELTITITNLKNKIGNVSLLVFKEKTGFPSNSNDASFSFSFPIDKENFSVSIDIPYGTYAISAIHDENKNNKLDTKFFLPQEGVACSNNPKTKFGPPKFNDAKFDFSEKNNKISLNITYLTK